MMVVFSLCLFDARRWNGGWNELQLLSLWASSTQEKSFHLFIFILLSFELGLHFSLWSQGITQKLKRAKKCLNGLNEFLLLKWPKLHTSTTYRQSILLLWGFSKSQKWYRLSTYTNLPKSQQPKLILILQR